MILILCLLLFCDRLGQRTVPPPTPTVKGEALGRAYSTWLLSTYADSWLVAAKALEEGHSVAEAQQILQSSWNESRTQAFRSQVQPAFSVFLSEEKEPLDPAQRARVVSLWRSFATGLRASHSSSLPQGRFSPLPARTRPPVNPSVDFQPTTQSRPSNFDRVD
ncbi:MAG: hypothetical protein NVSMB9_28070 [Isosphaeraceae bacterium]